jgi:hypothetical protein
VSMAKIVELEGQLERQIKVLVGVKVRIRVMSNFVEL